VSRGNKEAQWNHKYMKIVEKPVQTIERAEDFKAIQLNVGILLKTLDNIFRSSRFYREVRMVSFLDRLLQVITAKIKKRVTLAKAIKEAAQGPRSAETFIETQIKGAMESIQKFEDGYFIREHMEEQDSTTKVSEALGHTQTSEEQEESKKKASGRNPMGDSFYRKQGIDFLNF